MIPVAWINYLVFQLFETNSVKVLGGALTGKLNLMSGYTLNPLDMNRWRSLGLAVDPATPRLLSEGRQSALNLMTQRESFPFATYQTPSPPFNTTVALCNLSAFISPTYWELVRPLIKLLHPLLTQLLHSAIWLHLFLLHTGSWYVPLSLKSLHDTFSHILHTPLSVREIS